MKYELSYFFTIINIRALSMDLYLMGASTVVSWILLDMYPNINVKYDSYKLNSSIFYLKKII